MKKSMTIQNGIWAGALPGGRKKTAQRRLYMGEFKGYSGKNGEMTLLNLETDFPFLPLQRPLHTFENTISTLQNSFPASDFCNTSVSKKI